MEKAKQIIDYYDCCESDYRLFWDLNHSLAMHAGFWDGKVKNLRQALQRENEILADMVRVTSDDYILDAGCGVGGSSVFLAQNYRCKVKGITLSQKQVEKAKSYAAQKKLTTYLDFEVADFCQTPFPDSHFDIVWAIESVCHAQNKSAFLKEAFRILKPKGRLIVADGFMKANRLTNDEERQMKKWLNGWGCDSLESLGVFEDQLGKVGFHLLNKYDATHWVLPSSKRLFWLSLPTIILSKIGEWMTLRTKMQTANIIGALYQYRTLKKGLWNYGVFLAQKP